MTAHHQMPILQSMFGAAITAASAETCLPPHLPNTKHSGKTLVLGAGKAAGAMAQALENSWQHGPLGGMVITRYGHGCQTSLIPIIEAAHPIPDAASEAAARSALQQATALTENDLLIFLLSGGASSLLALPAPGLSLDDKRSVTSYLLRCGADIHEINCVRKHLSAIKGGRLTAAAFPAQVITLAISDVVGDDPATIGSGPTVADPTTVAQALKIIAKYKIPLPANVAQHLSSEDAKSPGRTDNRLRHNPYTLIATADTALAAAEQVATAAGYRVLNLGGAVNGAARAVARNHADMALSALDKGEKLCILSGGETTVDVKGSGRGGRNSTYLLALAIALAGAPGISAMACDTDGIDGSEDNAGAWISPDTWQAVHNLRLDARDYLNRDDAYSFFEKLGQLIVTGPTRTNVNDFRAILIDPT